MGVLYGGKREIRRAKLLGVREAHETLLFYTANFTLYSFWVEYTDGETEVIECSPEPPTGNKRKQKQMFNRLMEASDTKQRAPETVSRETDASIMDELQKLNDLHESGVIPDALFSDKKTSLLDKLSNSACAEREDQNIFITRSKPRPVGEAKTLLFIDGVNSGLNLDNPASIRLDSGEHYLQFKRSAVSSQEIHIFTNKTKKYEILFSTKIFSIDTELKEIK